MVLVQLVPEALKHVVEAPSRDVVAGLFLALGCCPGIAVPVALNAGGGHADGDFPFTLTSVTK